MPARLTKKRVLVAIGLVAAAAPVVFLLVFWFGAQRTGETRVSPNLRHEAGAFNLSYGTLWGSRTTYVEITLTDAVTKRELWRTVHRHDNGEKVIDYGMRGQTYVKWAEDSRSVRVQFNDQSYVVLPVP